MNSLTFSVASFRNAQDNQPKQGTMTWEQLKDKLTAPHKSISVYGLENHLPLSKEWKDALDKAKKNHPLFSPVLYKPGTSRSNANVESVSCFVADLENLTPSELTEIQASWEGLTWCLYTSVKHRPEAPRLRVVFPLAAPVPASEWPRVWQKLTYHLTHNRNDASTKDAARMSLLPIVAKGEEESALTDFNEGAFLERLDKVILGHRRLVIGVALGAAAMCAASLPWLTFDFDPLHLKSAKVESVATLLELMLIQTSPPIQWKSSPHPSVTPTPWRGGWSACRKSRRRGPCRASFHRTRRRSCRSYPTRPCYWI